MKKRLRGLAIVSALLLGPEVSLPSSYDLITEEVNLIKQVILIYKLLTCLPFNLACILFDRIFLNLSLQQGPLRPLASCLISLMMRECEWYDEYNFYHEKCLCIVYLGLPVLVNKHICSFAVKICVAKL